MLRVDVLDVVLRQFEGVDAADLGAGAQGRLFGSFRRQFGHQAARDHPQASGCGRAGVTRFEVQRAGLFFQLGDRFRQAFADVCVDRGPGLGGSQQFFSFQIYGGHLRVGAAEIDQKYGSHFLSSSESLL